MHELLENLQALRNLPSDTKTTNLPPALSPHPSLDSPPRANIFRWRRGMKSFFSLQRTCGKGKAMGEQQKHLNLHRSCTYDVNAFAILTLRAKHFIPTRDLNVNAILCTLATHPHSYLSLCAFTSEVFFLYLAAWRTSGESSVEKVTKRSRVVVEIVWWLPRVSGTNEKSWRHPLSAPELFAQLFYPLQSFSGCWRFDLNTFGLQFMAERVENAHFSKVYTNFSLACWPDLPRRVVEGFIRSPVCLTLSNEAKWENESWKCNLSWLKTFFVSDCEMLFKLFRVFLSEK